MTELSRVRLRTFGWFMTLPVTFLGLMPWWLHRRLEGPFVWKAAGWQWLGLWLILNGLGLSGWCVNLFNVEGRGTPVPFDPPKRFVASGPYRFVRNPMALGLFLVLAGQAALYQSKVILGYLLIVIALVGAFVRFIEEPDLERRFGAPYTAYKRQVPRWIPRSVQVGPRRISGAQRPQIR